MNDNENKGGIMLQSKLAPIIAGIVILIGAVLWAWTINSIDYSKMEAQGKGVRQPGSESPAPASPAAPALSNGQ